MSNNTTHQISLEQAVEMTSRYRENRRANFPLYETFERQAIDRLLATAGCEYLRIYYGMKADMQADAILVAVDTNNQDILPTLQTTTAEQLSADDDPIVVEDGYRCPQFCPSNSPLNP